jgi:hypothetical protein
MGDLRNAYIILVRKHRRNAILGDLEMAGRIT